MEGEQQASLHLANIVCLFLDSVLQRRILKINFRKEQERLQTLVRLGEVAERTPVTTVVSQCG